MTLAPNQDRPSHAPGRSFRIPDGWAPAFDAVPRSLFLPDLMWAHDMATGTSRPVDRTSDPASWQKDADDDIPIVTQWDDGHHHGADPGVVPTSSASMPSVVASMLADLDVRPGMRVLEIGTGTGWNAGLLAHRLGDESVVSVEVDPAVAETARERLAAADLHPLVVTGDGYVGYLPGAPFDRIIVTCGMRHIPSAWLGQVRPGGIILAPWGTHFENGDALVRLTVRHDGTASGPFLRPVEFMKMRAQRLVWPEPPASGGTVAESTTSVALPPMGHFAPFPFAMGLRLRAVTHAVQPHEDGRTLWLYSLAEPAWASATFRDGENVHQVRQYGQRRLWDEFEAALGWWRGRGEPGFERFGLTVDHGGQRAWLDSPERLVHV